MSNGRKRKNSVDTKWNEKLEWSPDKGRKKKWIKSETDIQNEKRMRSIPKEFIYKTIVHGECEYWMLIAELYKPELHFGSLSCFQR